MSKKVCIKQHDITDCGAACLASISEFYGLSLPISRIRQMASTTQRGTNILGLVEAAEKLGFSAKGVKSKYEDGTNDLRSLYKIPKPAIAHVIEREVLLHFVVIYKVTKTEVRVMDPMDGKMHTLTLDEFNKKWTGIMALLVPQDEFRPRNEKISISQRMWELFKPHKSEIFQSLFGAIIYTIIGLSVSIYVQKIIDYVIPDNNRNLMNVLSVGMIILLLLSLFINYWKGIFMTRTGLRIDAKLILGYYKYLLRLPQTFFDNMRTGEIISRVNDAIKIRTFINETMIGLAVSVFTFIFSFGLMFTYYWKLALIIFCIVPLYAIIYFIYNSINKKLQRRLMEQSADMESQLFESINAISTIKRFGIEDFANMKTEARFVKLLDSIYTSGKSGLMIGTASEFVSRLFTIILLWAGTYFVMGNIITPGELLSFYAIIAYFTGPVSSLIGMNRTLQDARIAGDRLFEIMDLEHEDNEQKTELRTEQIGDIVFEDVYFRYGSRDNVFNGLSLRFAKGKVSAVVGESGSGKTTLTSIIQNLYPLESGKVMIGEVDIRHISPRSLRDRVGVVPQKIDLFEGSIIDNIALGDFSPDMEKILSICRQIGILSFIESLPFGFHTNIGENGSKLSGGQRQRIAIARALYKDPDVLILDEATSALDSESELHIKNVIESLKMQGKTVIVIAHRLGTIMNSDCIYVLHEGTLVEEGNHRQLVYKYNGFYSKYWKTQTSLN